MFFIRFVFDMVVKKLSFNCKTCPFLAKYWSEDDGCYKDGAEDDPSLGDGDSLGQGLGGVEGRDEGERDPGDEDSPADQDQVEHRLREGRLHFIRLGKIPNIYLSKVK